MADAHDGDGPDQSLAATAREIEEFVAAGGWEQPVALFGLVETAQLLAAQPALADEVDSAAPWTPIAQESLPEGELDEALAKIVWPESVHGAALAQEIVVLPPDAEEALPEGDDPDDTARLRDAAANHPMRTEARLVATVLRDGSRACVMRLRAREGDDEIIERPELAPNLLQALEETLRP